MQLPDARLWAPWAGGGAALLVVASSTAALACRRPSGESGEALLRTAARPAFFRSLRGTAATLLVVASTYALAVAELLAGGLFAGQLRGLLPCLALLAIAATAEAEHSTNHLTAPHSTSSCGAWWRLRAATRVATAVIVGWPHFAACASGTALELEPSLLALGAALVAGGFALLAVCGPAALCPTASPPAPLRQSALVPKLLYLFWWRWVRRFSRIDRTRSEPLGADDLPSLDPRQGAALCVAAVGDSRERRGLPRAYAASSRVTAAALLRDVLRLVRGEACLQGAWCIYTLLMVYAAPLGTLHSRAVEPHGGTRSHPRVHGTPMIGMSRLIDFVDERHGGGSLSGAAIGYGCLVALGPLLSACGDAQTFNNGWLMGTRIRAFLTHTLADKALRFDPCASSASVGELTNLLAVDANNITIFTPGASWLFLEGAQLVLTLAFLFYILGPGALGGLAVCLVFLPLNAVVMRVIKRLQDRLMKEKDQRMAAVSEALGAIRTIKLNGWEDEFEARIGALRAKEIATLRAFQNLGAITSTLWLCAPSMAALASFLVKNVLLHEDITASQGFTSLTLFQLLSVSMTFLPAVLNQAIQSWVGLRRIARFISLPDVDGLPAAAGGGEGGFVEISRGSFRWSEASIGKDAGEEGEDGVAPLLVGQANRPTASPPATLDTISLLVRPGELALVCGPTGCGKSSVLAALCGEIPRLGGTVVCSGRVSYCPQRAFVMNATLRDNILFGSPYEASRYRAVLEACALEPDLKLLPAGDMTEIGEKGVNLSGGQQQRINLARACYARSDIVLLDDILSAVDAHVGQHLFDRCINGFLAGRTRILVTHSVASTLERASTVIVMGEGGRVLAQDTPFGEHEAIAALRTRSRPPSTLDLSALAPATPATEAAMAGEHGLASTSDTGDGGSGDSGSGGGGGRGGGGGAGDGGGGAGDGGGGGGGGITKVEERARGAAKAATYRSYLAAAGSWRFHLLFLATCIAFSSLSPLQSVALKMWVASMAPGASGDSSRPCLLYVLAGVAFITTTLARNVLLPSASVRASRRMHAAMTATVLRARISWFEATPLGRILNRFSSDISAVDQQVANQCKDTLVISFNVVAITLVCTLGSGDAASQLVVLGDVLLATASSTFVYSSYRTPARELKRLESVTKSPLFARFAEMVSGAAVVRAFGEQQRFLATTANNVDCANRALFYLWHTNQWLRVSMNLVGSMVTGAVVASVLWQADKLEGGDAGLTLSYATQFTQAIMWFFRIYTQLEVSMNDVERINEFSRLETEAYEQGEPPAPEWPGDGTVSFKNVRLQYATAAAPVFARLSFTVPARTRCGVVGRTGAGKSSLAVALFRVVELSAGSICIGGADHQSIRLQTMRSRLSIIQQEPTLFRGTVRYNLDPVGDGGGGDARLWDALRRAGLEAKVRALQGGLDAEVSEGGANLSAGERQLVCMARALLKAAPILVMDEATANVDHETDTRIQTMIREDFCGTTTVLTVAHRLNTIAFYERVLVLDAGAVVEYDSPRTLLDKPGGAFRSLAEESGEMGALRAAAASATEA